LKSILNTLKYLSIFNYLDFFHLFEFYINSVNFNINLES
jgi:hypothetical protein